MSPVLKNWTPALTGFIFAFAAMGWLRPLPIRVTSLRDLLLVYFMSVLYVLAVTGISALTAWLAWRLIVWITHDMQLPRFTWRIASRAAWIAPITLFLVARSRWALMAAVLAVLGLVHVLRILQPAVKQSPALSSGWKIFTCVVAGACIEGGFIAAGAERLGWALLTCMAATWILSWHATRPGPRGHAARGLVTVFFALVFTAGVLVRNTAIGPNDGFMGFPVDPLLSASLFTLQSVFSDHPPQFVAMKRGENGRKAGGTNATVDGIPHRGIYLWPEEKKEVTLVPPLPSPGFKNFGKNNSTPLTIPFYGAYWFFQPPYRKPPVDSLVMFGSPAIRRFLSNDNTPLWEEAHQNLLKTFELRCCGRIEIDVTNADKHSDFVEIELSLVDNTPIPKIIQLLGTNRLLTRPTSVAAVETLSFDVPTITKMKGFDELTVRFRLGQGHWSESAQVAIERFRLIPKVRH